MPAPVLEEPARYATSVRTPARFFAEAPGASAPSPARDALQETPSIVAVMSPVRVDLHGTPVDVAGASPSIASVASAQNPCETPGPTGANSTQEVYESPCDVQLGDAVEEWEVPGVVPQDVGSPVSWRQQVSDTTPISRRVPSNRQTPSRQIPMASPAPMVSPAATLYSTPKSNPRLIPAVREGEALEPPTLLRASSGGGRPVLNSLGGPGMAVPAVSLQSSDSLEHLRFTSRHPDEANNSAGDGHEDASRANQCCRICLTLPCLVLFSPVILLCCMLTLCLLPMVMFLWPDQIKDTEGEGDEEMRNRSSHNPRFMRPLRARAAPGASLGVPETLRGIFYLRNHPFDHVLLCFERGTWNAERSEMRLPWRLPRARAFKDTRTARLALVARWLFRFHSELKLSDVEERRPIEVRIHLKAWGIPLPKYIISHGMRDVSRSQDGSLWKFERAILGRRSKPYWAERVVDARGAETPYLYHVRYEVPSKCIFI